MMDYSIDSDTLTLWMTRKQKSTAKPSLQKRYGESQGLPSPNVQAPTELEP